MRITTACLAWFLLALASSVQSAPVVTAAGYDIQLYATGLGAISGMQIGPDGKVYAADNAGGRVLRVEPDRSVTVIASGIPYANGITFTKSGRTFVASGDQQAVYEIVNGNAAVFATMGSNAYPTSVAARGNTLYVSNSGNGSISRVRMDGSVQVVVSGFSNSGGPYGLSFDKKGTAYFLDNATGGVYSYDLKHAPVLLTSVTAGGGTFTNPGFKGRLFITDVALGDLMWFGAAAGTTVFASGFSGMSRPPHIGPNGIAFDGCNKLYVGDGGSIYLVTRTR